MNGQLKGKRVVKGKEREVGKGEGKGGGGGDGRTDGHEGREGGGA